MMHRSYSILDKQPRFNMKTVDEFLRDGTCPRFAPPDADVPDADEREAREIERADEIDNDWDGLS